MSSTSIPTVDLVAGRPVVSSLRLAEHFGKVHKNVIRDIRNVLTSVSDDFNRLNFELVEYIDEKGETRPMYNLTRDGFTIVAMSYTGPEAMRMKEAYIRRFNEMERTLAHGPAAAEALPVAQPVALPASHQDTLRRLINSWADIASMPRARARAEVRRAMNVDRLDRIPAADMDRAISFVLGKMEHARTDAAQTPPAIATPNADMLLDYGHQVTKALRTLRESIDAVRGDLPETYGKRLAAQAGQSMFNNARMAAYESATLTLSMIDSLAWSGEQCWTVLMGLEKAAKIMTPQ